jgi:hypothetical protein
MSTIAETAPVAKPARWTGRVLSGLVIVFLLFDGAIKLVPWPIVTETMDKMGYGSSETLARSLGIITIVCTVLYSVPPTSILGAILLTGYLGGAISSRVRPSFHPHAVRLLSRPNGMGRAVAARSEFAQFDSLSTLTCIVNHESIRSLTCSKSLPPSPSCWRLPSPLC